MTETALITMFGDALVSTGDGNKRDALKGVVLERRDIPFLSLESNRLVNAPPSIGIVALRPCVYRLHDAQGRVYSHAPDGTRDDVMERASWGELSCLNLRRFPEIAPSADDFTPIPRLLHFICNDPATLDPAFVTNIAQVTALNPGWTVHVWDEASRFQFISDHYGWDVLKIYLMIGGEYGAAKADFFRYLLIYRLGGVYLDLKSSMSRPLEAILRPDDQYLISQWNMSGSGRHAGWGLGASIAHVKGGEYQQWFLIARPGHPYLRRVIQLVMTKILTYRPDVHGVGAVTTFNITGPHAYTKAIHAVRENFAHRVFDAETDGLIYASIENHRERSGSTYREARTPLVTGNESCLC
ncbi:glycosyltransferase [Asaia sp. HN010]|uniref:glycosyltransferase family 32 protein n=1 Tax=Asaia sp. HN010 TaxID=3081233 RepID=UPI00301696C5